MNGRLGPLPKHVEEQIMAAANVQPHAPVAELRLTLPYPPTINHYWRHVIINGQARIVLGGVGKKYRKAVHDALLDQGVRVTPWPTVMADRLEVSVVVHPPTRQRWDLDNRLKPLLDALVEAGVMADDSLIDHLAIHRGLVSRRPRAEVVIRAVPEAGLFPTEAL